MGPQFDSFLIYSEITHWYSTSPWLASGLNVLFGDQSLHFQLDIFAWMGHVFVNLNLSQTKVIIILNIPTTSPSPAFPVWLLVLPFCLSASPKSVESALTLSSLSQLPYSTAQSKLGQFCHLNLSLPSPSLCHHCQHLSSSIHHLSHKQHSLLKCSPCVYFFPFPSILHMSTRKKSLKHKPGYTVSLLNPFESSPPPITTAHHLYMHSCILLFTASHSPQYSFRMTDASRIACIHRCGRNGKRKRWKPTYEDGLPLWAAAARQL